jgi:hypothetical protein
VGEPVKVTVPELCVKPATLQAAPPTVRTPEVDVSDPAPVTVPATVRGAGEGRTRDPAVTVRFPDHVVGSFVIVTVGVPEVLSAVTLLTVDPAKLTV